MTTTYSIRTSRQSTVTRWRSLDVWAGVLAAMSRISPYQPVVRPVEVHSPAGGHEHADAEKSHETTDPRTWARALHRCLA